MSCSGWSDQLLRMAGLRRPGRFGGRFDPLTLGALAGCEPEAPGARRRGRVGRWAGTGPALPWFEASGWLMVLHRRVAAPAAGRGRRGAPCGGGFRGRAAVHRRSVGTPRARWRSQPLGRGPAHGPLQARLPFRLGRRSRRCLAPRARNPASWRGSRWRGCRSSVCGAYPPGRTWSRKRRMNSSAETVMVP